jgi:hypothetical protein
MRYVWGLLLAVVLVASPAAALAQQASFNPFADAEAVMGQRGVSPNATLRLEYRHGESVNGAPRTETTVTFLVASDWALVQQGESSRLLDFRLGRYFDIGGDGKTFVAKDLTTPVAVMVTQLQNRMRLLSVLKGPEPTIFDECDAETEWAITIPNSGAAKPVVTPTPGGGGAFVCNGRQMGAFAGGAGISPPAAFWPAMALSINMHPTLLRAARASDRAPSAVSAAWRGSRNVDNAWTLTKTEAVDAPYPLTAGMTSANAAEIDKALGAAGVGAIAAEAVAGRALGGPPTLENWDRTVAAAARKSPAEAALLFPMSLNMFPALEADCRAGARLAICAVLRALPETRHADPAVRAILEIIVMEQRGQVSGVVDAMVAARASPLATHPALMQSYALALLKFDPPQRKRARAAGLPVEPLQIMAQTVKSYPYNPAYWTDIAGVFASVFDWHKAGWLYDVALGTPMPQAQANNAVLRNVRQFRARLRADFRQYFAVQ